MQPNSTLTIENIVEIDKILQFTGGFSLKPSATFGKDDGFTHIISNYSDDALWNFCGSKDNTYPPFLVTIDWLRDSFLQSTRVSETLYIPKECDRA